MATPGLWCWPDADDTDGGWSPSTGTDLYAVLDIANWGTSDLAYIETGNNPSNDFCRVACAAISNPGEDDGHQLFTTHRCSAGGGRQIDLTVHAYNATTEVGSGNQYTAISSTSTDALWEIPSADVGGTPGFSYTDPRIGLTADAVGGGATNTAQVIVAWYRIYGDTKSGNKSILSDDFESNSEIFADAKTTNGTSATADVQAGGAITGTYGLDCSADNASDNADTEYLQYWFGHEDPCVDVAADKIVVDFTFRWDSWTRGGYNSATSKGPIAIYNNVGRMAWLSVAGTRTLQLMYKNGDGTDTKVTGTQQFTLATTYEIRVIIDRTGANPVISWDVDGSQIGTATDSGSTGSNGVKINSQNNPFHYINAGILHINQWEAMGYDWSIDDLYLWDSEVTFAVVEQLAGLAAGAATASGAIKVSKKIAGISNTSSAPTGVLNATRKIAGQADGVGTNSGAVKIAKKIAGQADGVAAVTGSAGRVRFMDGLAAGVSAVTAALKPTRRIAGQADGVSTVTGVAKRNRRILGQSDGSSALTLVVKVLKKIVAQADGVSTVTGSLTVTAGGVVEELIAGVTAGVSTVTGALSVLKKFVGQTDGSSAVTAVLKPDRGIAGQADGVSTVSAVLKPDRGIAGQVDGTSTVAGVMKRNRGIAGASAGVSTVAGVMKRNIGLGGVSAGITSLAPKLSYTASMKAISAGAAGGQGTLRFVGEAIRSSPKRGWGPFRWIRF